MIISLFAFFCVALIYFCEEGEMSHLMSHSALITHRLGSKGQSSALNKTKPKPTRFSTFKTCVISRGHGKKLCHPLEGKCV